MILFLLKFGPGILIYPYRLLKNPLADVDALPDYPEDLAASLLKDHLLASDTLTLYSLNHPHPVALSGTVLALSCSLAKLEIVKALLANGGGWASGDDSGTSNKGKGWVLVDSRDGKGGTGLMCKWVCYLRWCCMS